MRPGMMSGYSPAPLNLIAPAVTHHKAVSGHEERMKIALLALLGLALGALGGAALGIGAGLAWLPGIHVFLRQPQGGVDGRAIWRDDALCPAMTFA
jgi:hypothetical protein